jgi:hypothetical protein
MTNINPYFAVPLRGRREEETALARVGAWTVGMVRARSVEREDALFAASDPASSPALTARLCADAYNFAASSNRSA